MPCSITGAPASTLTPPGRKLSNARCAVMASAFSPTMSLGRPGRCTSPAEIIVVTPPFIVESIQPSWFWRGVQSPNTGCTWLSIRPGRDAGLPRVDHGCAPVDVAVLLLAHCGDQAVVDDDGVGVEDGPVDVAREQQADVADDDLARLAGGCGVCHVRAPREVAAVSSDAAASTVRSTVVDHERFPVRQRRRRLQRLAEKGRQRVAVRQVEVAQSPRSSGRRRAPPRRCGTALARRRCAARCADARRSPATNTRAPAATCAMCLPRCRFSVFSSVMNSGFFW